MVTQKISSSRIPHERMEPFDLFDDYLHKAWNKMVDLYDASMEMPGNAIIFDEVDLEKPEAAARKIIVNLLQEAIDQIGRFSPWYTRPARAFGLVSTFLPQENRYIWDLAPEVLPDWEPCLANFTAVIQKNPGLVQAMILLGQWAEEHGETDPTITARCGCDSPIIIQIKRSVFLKCEILCQECGQYFR